MKKIIMLISLNAMLSLFGHAQNSWIRQLPDNGEIVKMIPTIDGKYALLAWSSCEGYEVKYIMYKYTDTGNMEWRKEILPCKNQTINDFIQLTNGNYVLAGRVLIDSVNSTFICLLNDVGDTLWSDFIYYHYQVDFSSGFYKAIEATQTEIWATGGGDTIYLHRYDLQGNLLNKHLLPYNPTKFIKIGIDSFLICSQVQTYPSKYLFKAISYDMDSIFEKYYFITPTCIKQTIDNGFIIHGYFYNDKGLVKLGAGLDSLWAVPYSHYWTYGGTNYAPNDLIVTSDGGYAMCGTRIWTDHKIVYFIKTDDLGNPQIQTTYSSSIVDYTANLLQSPDGGYVMFQRASTNHTLWLVKTNSDGILPVEENFAYKWNDVTVYPNPVCSVANIDFNGEFSGELCVYNMLGQLKINLIISNETSTQIDVTNFQNGFYILKISNSNNKSVISKKIIKQ